MELKSCITDKPIEKNDEDKEENFQNEEDNEIDNKE